MEIQHHTISDNFRKYPQKTSKRSGKTESKAGRTFRVWPEMSHCRDTNVGAGAASQYVEDGREHPDSFQRGGRRNGPERTVQDWAIRVREFAKTGPHEAAPTPTVALQLRIGVRSVWLPNG